MQDAYSTLKRQLLHDPPIEGRGVLDRDSLHGVRALLQRGLGIVNDRGAFTVSCESFENSPILSMSVPSFRVATRLSSPIL
jgi:hypothetical protein